MILEPCFTHAAFATLGKIMLVVHAPEFWNEDSRVYHTDGHSYLVGGNITQARHLDDAGRQSRAESRNMCGNSCFFVAAWIPSRFSRYVIG